MSDETTEMSIAEILAAISIPGPYRRDAVEAALTQQEAIIPELIRILQELRANPVDFIERSDYLYALFLLGHFKATAAHTVMADLLRIDPEWANILFNQLITEMFPFFLYRTYDDDPESCKALVTDRHAEEFCRGVGADVLAFAVAEARFDREALLAFLSEVLTAELAEKTDSAIASLLVLRLRHLYPVAEMALIRQLYGAEMIDRRVIELEEIEQIISSSNPEESLAELRNEMLITQPRDLHTDDLHDELEEWLEVFDDEPDLVPLLRDAGDRPSSPRTKASVKKNKNKRKMVKSSRKKNRRK